MAGTGWISLAEAGRILGITRNAVWERLRRGELHGVKAGSNWRVRESEVQAMAERDRAAAQRWG